MIISVASLAIWTRAGYAKIFLGLRASLYWGILSLFWIIKRVSWNFIAQEKAGNLSPAHIDPIDPKDVVAILPFRYSRDNQHIPAVSLKIGDVEIEGLFDIY